MDAAHGQQELTSVKTATRVAIKTTAKGARLLVISTGAGSMTPELQAKLHSEFADHLIIDFDPKHDFEKLINPRRALAAASLSKHKEDGLGELVRFKRITSKAKPRVRITRTTSWLAERRRP